MATAGKRKEPAVISIALLNTAIEEDAKYQEQLIIQHQHQKHHHGGGHNNTTNNNNENTIPRPATQISEAVNLQLSFRSM